MRQHRSKRSVIRRALSAATVLPVVVLILTLIGSVSVEAQQSTSPQRKPNPAAGGDVGRVGRGELTPEQEASALQFAQEHHAELVKLLDDLRTSDRRNYERGIRDLSAVQARLARSRERNPERHAKELELWQTESRIRLLVARWSMQQDPQLEKQIREQLELRERRRLVLLKEDQKRAQQRATELANQIKSREADLGQHLDREWARLTRQAAVARKSAQGKAESARRAASTDEDPAGRRKPRRNQSESDPGNNKNPSD